MHLVSQTSLFVNTVGCVKNDVRIERVTVCLNGALCHMMCAYGPTLGHGARREFWKEMEKEIEKIKTIPCCILGDLNALEKDDEATGLVHAKELVQPLLKMWSERKILFDLWKWHGKKEGPEALTRAKPSSTNQGSRIDRILLSSLFVPLLKTSDVSTLDWALSDHKALQWEIDLLSDSDWAASLREKQNSLNLRRWNDATQSQWLQSLSSLEMKYPSFSGDLSQVRSLFDEMRPILDSLVVVGSEISGRQQRLKKALRERKWEQVEKIKREMMMDKSEQVRGKKSGKSKTRELFALKKEGKWVLGDELDNLVAQEMPRFGARSPPQDGWGRMGIERLKDDKKEHFSPPSREDFFLL